jgi:hypothetical protein
VKACIIWFTLNVLAYFGRDLYIWRMFLASGTSLSIYVSQNQGQNSTFTVPVPLARGAEKMEMDPYTMTNVAFFTTS